MRLPLLLTALLLTACNPVVDALPLDLPDCSPEDSPTELARLPYDPDADFKTYDLVDGVTVEFDPRNGDPSTHYLVDNCGGEPLRLARTFSYRPGAAYVGGEVVLCSGGLGDREGVWELLEDGTAGRDLGLGRLCMDFVSSGHSDVALSSLGIVAVKEVGEVTQYLPDGRTRTISDWGEFFRAGDAHLVQGRDGTITVLPPDGSDTIMLDLPHPIDSVFNGARDSTWVLAQPPLDLEQAPLYAVDAATGVWFPTDFVYLDRGTERWSVRDGLAAVLDRFGDISISRPGWEQPMILDIESTSGHAVVDAEHIYLRSGDELRMIAVPTAWTDESPAPVEVVWTRDAGSTTSAPTGWMARWNTVMLGEDGGNVIAYPIDGGEPFPILPQHGKHRYYGQEFVTAIGVRRDQDVDTRSLIRNNLSGEFEILDEGILDTRKPLFSPELGRLLYAVRDGDEVSIRQHRLTD